MSRMPPGPKGRSEQHSLPTRGEPFADASRRALRREHERTSVAPGLDALETPQGLADAGHGFASGREIGAEHGRRVEPAREIEEPRPEGVLVGEGLGRDDEAEIAPLADPRDDALEHRDRHQPRVDAVHRAPGDLRQPGHALGPGLVAVRARHDGADLEARRRRRAGHVHGAIGGERRPTRRAAPVRERPGGDEEEARNRSGHGALGTAC